METWRYDYGKRKAGRRKWENINNGGGARARKAFFLTSTISPTNRTLSQTPAPNAYTFIWIETLLRHQACTVQITNRKSGFYLSIQLSSFVDHVTCKLSRQSASHCIVLCCVLCAVCCVLCAVCCVLCAVCCVLCTVYFFPEPSIHSAKCQAEPAKVIPNR